MYFHLLKLTTPHLAWFIPSQFSSVQSLSRVRLFATPWFAARQASLSITNSQSSLRLMSIESVMPSSHLILCRPLLLLPPIPPSIRDFSNESTLCMKWPKYWSFSFSIIPSQRSCKIISRDRKLWQKEKRLFQINLSSNSASTRILFWKRFSKDISLTFPRQCHVLWISTFSSPLLLLWSWLVLLWKWTYLAKAMEKAMAPYSSTLTWRIPWMEEPGRLQSMRSIGVGHDWATSLSLFTFMHWRRKWQPTSVFLPGESQGQKSLVGCRLWGRTESDTTVAT